MSKLPFAYFRRDRHQAHVFPKSLLITLSAFIHVLIALAILNQAAAMLA